MAAAEPAGADAVRIDVVRSVGPDQTELLRLTLAAGATLADAIAAAVASGWPAPLRAGVWGRLRPPEHRLCEHDRVEFYRALAVDPMQARRLREQRQRAERPATAGRRRPRAAPPSAR